jgi:hypothetical protein
VSSLKKLAFAISANPTATGARESAPTVKAGSLPS